MSAIQPGQIFDVLAVSHQPPFNSFRYLLSPNFYDWIECVCSTKNVYNASFR